MNILSSNFDVLDFMWYAFRFIALGAGILFFFFLGLTSVSAYLNSRRARKKEKEIEKALMKALKEGKFSVGVEKKEDND